MKAAAALMRFAAVILITVILGSAQTGCGSGGTQSVRDNTETLDQRPEEWFYDSFDPVKKAAYEAFRIAAENPFDEEPVPVRNEEGEITSITIKDLDEAYQGFLYDHPEVFCGLLLTAGRKNSPMQWRLSRFRSQKKISTTGKRNLRSLRPVFCRRLKIQIMTKTEQPRFMIR